MLGNCSIGGIDLKTQRRDELIEKTKGQDSVRQVGTVVHARWQTSDQLVVWLSVGRQRYIDSLYI